MKARLLKTSGGAMCTLCEKAYTKPTVGVMVDLTHRVVNVTLMKFVCEGCVNALSHAAEHGQYSSETGGTL